MPPRTDDDGRMIDRLDERTQDHGRRITSMEVKLWAAVAAGFSAFVGQLFIMVSGGN